MTAAPQALHRRSGALSGLVWQDPDLHGGRIPVSFGGNDHGFPQFIQTN
jgi:hypothetical protein